MRLLHSFTDPILASAPSLVAPVLGVASSVMRWHPCPRNDSHTALTS
jgi:hypothetical protein